MKRVEKCAIEDCIPTPSSCVKWNGGDIPFLGICDGDCLNLLMEELIAELQKIAGKDLSTFDINSLLAICEKEAPEEITIISILSLLRDNHLCLKQFIDELNAQLEKLLEGTAVKVNLKCYTGFNGIGLSISRDQLDQLIIDILCGHERALDSIDDNIVRMQTEINEKALAKRIEEITAVTCVNTDELPLSKQIQEVSQEVCDFRLVTGNASAIAAALANTPTDLNPEFGAIIGWNSSPAFWSEFYSNTLLEVENLRQRLITIETVCCAVTCDDITIAFTAVFNEDGSGVILRFNAGAGMIMPKGFEDCGSTGTITDNRGNTQDFDITISMGGVVEIPLENMATVGDLTVSLAAKICNKDKGLQCNKCVTKVVERAECAFCTLTASGPVNVIYKVCLS